MTEAEWLTCTDPVPMLAFLQKRIITLVDELPSEEERQAARKFLCESLPRKLVLFACACCREIWQAVKDPRSRKALELAEQTIDQPVIEDQLLHTEIAAAYDARNAIEHKIGDDSRETHIHRVAANACLEAVWSTRGFARSVAAAAHESADVAAWIGQSIDFLQARAKQAQFLHCIVRNPFRLVTQRSKCIPLNGEKTATLAQAIYDDRAFERMPELADALAEAGCSNPDILSHCRGPGPHVRGCWVVDLVLGKE
jgi:hypothetical protein